MNATDHPPLACIIEAIAPAHREAHESVTRRLFTERLLDVRDLPTGYAFLFAADAYDDLVAFIANERLCCPFFHFTLDVSPEQEDLSLDLTGREDVRAFIVENFFSLKG